MERNIFYTYVYLDPRKPESFDYGEFHFDFEPFYVGKGVRDQWLVHLKLAQSTSHKNSRKLNKIKKIQSLGLEPKVIKYKENLTEEAAFDLEKRLIRTIGRLDLGTGPLTNLTEGGEGVSGVIQSKETRQKKAEKKRGKKRGTKEDTPWIARQSEKMKVIMRGRTAETHLGVARGAEKRRGRKIGTKEDTLWIARMAEKMRGKIPWNAGKTKETDPRLAYTKRRKNGTKTLYIL